MNFASIFSLIANIGSSLFRLISTVDPALITHNKNTIASATSALQSAGTIAPEVAAGVTEAANIAAAVDPQAATAAADVSNAVNAVAGALSSLHSSAATAASSTASAPAGNPS